MDCGLVWASRPADNQCGGLGEGAYDERPSHQGHPRPPGPRLPVPEPPHTQGNVGSILQISNSLIA